MCVPLFAGDNHERIHSTHHLIHTGHLISIAVLFCFFTESIALMLCMG